MKCPPEVPLRLASGAQLGAAPLGLAGRGTVAGCWSWYPEEGRRVAGPARPCVFKHTRPTPVMAAAWVVFSALWFGIWPGRLWSLALDMNPWPHRLPSALVPLLAVNSPWPAGRVASSHPAAPLGQLTPQPCPGPGPAPSALVKAVLAQSGPTDGREGAPAGGGVPQPQKPLRSPTFLLCRAVTQARPLPREPESSHYRPLSASSLAAPPPAQAHLCPARELGKPALASSAHRAPSPAGGDSSSAQVNPTRGAGVTWGTSAVGKR